MNTASSERTAAEVIAQRLREAGCRHAFGIPGGEVLALMDALEHAGVAVTLAKHENCAGFMGEGTWHATKAPAVLFATIGPGVANAVNAIANAWQDRVPMIVLTGCVPSIEAHTYTHQVFDHVALLKPVTKASFRVEPGTAAVIADKAIAIATSGQPGPVVLDVPIDVQRESSSEWHVSRHAREQAMAPSGAALDDARSWLREAERPVMIGGVDILTQGCADEVEAFCRRFNVPFIASYKAKGVVPEDDALALGGAGLSPICDAELLPLVRASDCVLLAGYDPIEMRIGWRDPFGDNTRVIDIAAETNTHYMHQAALNFTGDIAASLAAIGEDVEPRPTWRGGEPARVKEALAGKLRLDEDWGPAAVIDEARKACPRSAVATVDSGAHRIVLSQIWQCYEAHGLLQSTALCTMGCAVPLAIGRKLAEPERPVIAFVGDAGLEMFLGELATARDLKLGIPIVVFVDRQLGLIELKQRGMQMPNLGVDFDGTDFTAVAVSMGGFGAEVSSRGELHTAIDEAFSRNSFTLISANIGRKAYDGRI
jgi:acetolactate synthase-1/2/3 large subunit